MRSRWTPEEDALLREWAGKIPFREISRRLGRNPGSADARGRALGLRGLPQGIARKRLAAKLDGQPRGWCPRRASVMHLIDLKRAGYSPRQTELIIRNEGALAMPLQPSAVFSSLGSPAAMCAID